jgi:hypothetical protein
VNHSASPGSDAHAAPTDSKLTIGSAVSKTIQNATRRRCEVLAPRCPPISLDAVSLNS